MSGTSNCDERQPQRWKRGLKMNNRPGGRSMTETRKQSMATKACLSSNYKEKEKGKVMGAKRAESVIPTATSSRQESCRDQKLALQQDVEKLKKKLQHEENVRRVLVRAFTRSLGALPRILPDGETSGRGCSAGRRSDEAEGAAGEIHAGFEPGSHLHFVVRKEFSHFYWVAKASHK